ncbi:MAG: S-methyl-5'-thioadenosine phosphorylase [Candidatus Omnitrophica bacterium]|nr:S-methyl-5'-thioadenosine phosphorylase [Candidatus Omnitrophota bacterium]
MGKIGIIGGSGLYKIEGIKNIREKEVDTPFGAPSDNFILGELEGKEVVFLPRHGVGHRISPSEINYRANIFAMKVLGVDRIISVSACGSLREELRPLDFVLPGQFVDRTNQARKMTFFSGGIVAHISFAEPVCRNLLESVYKTARSEGISIHKDKTYLNMEGPAFSTIAESNLYRSWGMDIIGMTNMAEARLAREAEICYVTLAAITDYDCWYPEHDKVTIEMIINNLNKNVDNAKNIIKQAVKNMPQSSDCGCGSALQYAILTDRKAIPVKVKRQLAPIIGKYIK